MIIYFHFVYFFFCWEISQYFTEVNKILGYFVLHLSVSKQRWLPAWLSGLEPKQLECFKAWTFFSHLVKGDFEECGKAFRTTLSVFNNILSFSDFKRKVRSLNSHWWSNTWLWREISSISNAVALYREEVLLPPVRGFTAVASQTAWQSVTLRKSMHMKTGVQVKATLYILQIKAMCKPSNQAFDVREQTSDNKSVGHGNISISCLAAEQNSSVYNRRTGKGWMQGG